MALGVEELEVFRRAYAVSLELHRSSLAWPAIEQRALADQVRRASKSICANLAEGFARRRAAPADFRRLVVMAIGSADEMRVWLRYAHDLGYLAAGPAAAWSREYGEIARMLQGLARHRGSPDR
jgi:four helix bundle protein